MSKNKRKNRQYSKLNIPNPPISNDKDFAKLPFWSRYIEFVKFLINEYRETTQNKKLGIRRKIKLILALVYRFCSLFDNIAIGVLPFSFEKMDKKDFLRRFPEKEQVVVKKVLRRLINMDKKNKLLQKEIEEPCKYVFWFVDGLIRTYDAIITIANIIVKGGLSLLLLCLRFACNFSWRSKEKNKKEKH